MVRVRRLFFGISAILLTAGLLSIVAGRALANGHGAQPPAAPSASQVPAPEKKETQGYTLSREKYDKAVEYSRAEYRLYFIDFVYGLLVLWVILRFGIATKYRDWAEGASGVRLVQVVIFVPLLMLTSAILELPTSIYGHSLSLKYEQSIQRWGSWFWDWTKGQMVFLIIATLLAWILYGVIQIGRASCREW